MLEREIMNLNQLKDQLRKYLQNELEKYKEQLDGRIDTLEQVTKYNNDQIELLEERVEELED
jgi:chaperonin cofactor prefoldin